MLSNVERIVAHLAEEGGELAQACGKYLRHGDVNNNVRDIIKEAADVKAVLDCFLDTFGDTMVKDMAFKDHYQKKYEKYSITYREDVKVC